MTVVLIAHSRLDAAAWVRRQPAPPARIVVVTPRSPAAARGWTADAVLMTHDDPRLRALVPDCMPSVAAAIAAAGPTVRTPGHWLVGEKGPERRS